MTIRCGVGWGAFIVYPVFQVNIDHSDYRCRHVSYSRFMHKCLINDDTMQSLIESELDWGLLGPCMTSSWLSTRKDLAGKIAIFCFWREVRAAPIISRQKLRAGNLAIFLVHSKARKFQGHFDFDEPFMSKLQTESTNTNIALNYSNLT